jgi:hypothetical protein
MTITAAQPKSACALLGWSQEGAALIQFGSNQIQKAIGLQA